MKSILKHTPPEREGWGTTGVFKNKTWRLKQNKENTVDFKTPTHWNNID